MKAIILSIIPLIVRSLRLSGKLADPSHGHVPETLLLTVMETVSLLFLPMMLLAMMMETWLTRLTTWVRTSRRYLNSGTWRMVCLLKIWSKRGPMLLLEWKSTG